MKFFMLLIICFVCLCGYSYTGAADEYELYVEYISDMNSVQTVSMLESTGFYPFERQSFNVDFPSIGAVKIVPALYEKYRRIALFFADENDNIVYATDDLYCNNWNEDRLVQNSLAIPASAFTDLNGDGLLDIIIISYNFSGSYGAFKIGDVLFQSEGGFYRDPLISEEINRLGMNIDIEMIATYVNYGINTEFLYSSATLQELLDNGFNIIDEHIYSINLDNFGQVDIVFGSFKMAGHYVLMGYILNNEGDILWNLQPMGKYDNFSNIRYVDFYDINGDGLTDITVTAIFNLLIETDSGYVTDSTTDSIWFLQENGGFTKTYGLRNTVIKPTLGYEEITTDQAPMTVYP